MSCQPWSARGPTAVGKAICVEEDAGLVESEVNAKTCKGGFREDYRTLGRF